LKVKKLQKIFKKIESMDFSELENFKKTVHNSFLDVQEKNRVLSKVEKKQDLLDKVSALVETSEPELD